VLCGVNSSTTWTLLISLRASHVVWTAQFSPTF